MSSRYEPDSLLGRVVNELEETAIAVILGLNLVITFLPGSNIAWQAHIGGGLVGALIGFIFARTRAVRQRRTQIWLLIAVAVGLLALLGVPLLVYR